MNKIKPKVIAHYLPQFHTIPENDLWWGKGFTEWVNVKKSKPLFKDHKQPRLPYNNNFYDLKKTEDLIAQSKLAKKYNIYGFCFYHYWFNGKLILEKPVENYLKEKKIETNFCFSWGNEKWTRAWDGLTSDILIDQDYGTEEDWLKHFNYLLPFFNDTRYIKVDNKPMFIIYRPTDIVLLPKMKLYWDNLAKKNGFEGIHIVCTLNGFQNDDRDQIFDSYLYFEPLNTIKYHLNKLSKFSFLMKSIIHDKIGSKVDEKKLPKKKLFYKVLSYKDLWEEILKKPLIKNGKNIFPGGFVEWDNTARKKNRATIIQYNKKEEFEKYFNKLYQKANVNRSEFIFINAWNEWAEGAYIEPDERNGFETLEVINKVVTSRK